VLFEISTSRSYGHLSVTIKTTFRLDQEQIDYGALFQNIGGNMGILFGPLYRKYGPKPVCLLGGLLGCLGYLLLWLSIFLSWDIHTNVWVLYAVMFLIGQAAVLTDLAVIPTVSNHFRDNSGMALGLCKSLVGLSGSLNEQIYSAFFKPDTVSYIGFLSFYFPFICLLCSFALKIPDTGVRFSKMRELTARGVIRKGILILGVLLLLLIVAIPFRNSSRGIRIGLTVAIFSVFASLIWFIASQSDEQADDDERLLDDEEVEVSETSVIQDMMGPSFLLQSMTCLIAWGSGFMLINNLGQIATIVRLSNDNKEVYVSIVSVSNCIGRILAGVVSDELKKRGYRRSSVFGVAVLLMSFSMLTLSVSTPSTFFIAAISCGMVFGGLNALNPAVLGELFHLDKLPTLYASTGISICFGSYIFATKLFSEVYEAHAEIVAGEESCTGPICLRLSALICAAANAIVGTIYLYYHRRHVTVVPQELD